MIYINNNRDNFASMKKDLIINPNIIIKNNFFETVLKVTLYNAFPSNLSEVILNYREGNAILESSFTLLYDYYVPEKKL